MKEKKMKIHLNLALLFTYMETAEGYVEDSGTNQSFTWVI